MPDELEKASEIVCKYCPYPYGEWAYCAYCVIEQIKRYIAEEEENEQ